MSPLHYLQPPDPLVVQKISNRLEELGVHVDVDTAAAIVSATLEWVTETNAGKEHVIKKFGFDWEGGKTDHVYYLMDTGDRVGGDDIYFLKTAVAKGRFVSPGLIDGSKVDKKGCDECGILAHCTRSFTDHQGKITEVCNNCLSSSDDSRRKNKSGGKAECEACTVELCQYNPGRTQRRWA